MLKLSTAHVFIHINLGLAATSTSKGDGQIVTEATSIFNRLGSTSTDVVNAFIKGTDATEALGNLRQDFQNIQKFVSSLLPDISGPIDGVDVQSFLKTINDISVQGDAATQTALSSAQPGTEDNQPFAGDKEQVSSEVDTVFKNLAQAAIGFFKSLDTSENVKACLQNVNESLQQVQKLISNVIEGLSGPVNGIKADTFLSNVNELVGQAITSSQEALPSAI